MTATLKATSCCSGTRGEGCGGFFFLKAEWSPECVLSGWKVRHDARGRGIWHMNEECSGMVVLCVRQCAVGD